MSGLVFYPYFCTLLGLNKYVSSTRPRTHLKDSGVTWRPHSVDSACSVRSHFCMWTTIALMTNFFPPQISLLIFNTLLTFRQLGDKHVPA